MNGRAEQDDNKQFDLGHQNPCTIIKASFTRSPIKGKRRTRLWHVLAGILDTITGSNPFKLFILLFRCAPIDETIAALYSGQTGRFTIRMLAKEFWGGTSVITFCSVVNSFFFFSIQPSRTTARGLWFRSSCRDNTAFCTYSGSVFGFPRRW
jgi:hypothetical protein